MKQKKSIWIKLLYDVGIFLLITWTFSTNLYVDESFTLGLIKHNWLEVIKLDAMDVHPPLYYLVLKLFLIITTFWTSSMIIKAIFARIFSVICFAIMSKGIQIIFKKSLNKNINFKIIFLGLLLLPNVLYHATCIRMYAFGAMLITWEFVCLIKYRQQNKISFLIYALMLAELAAYTHYFAAIIGGLLLVYEFFSSIKHKNYNSTMKLLISGVALLILFIPWGMIAFKQVSSVSQHYWISNNVENFVDLFYYRLFPLKIFFFIGFILLEIFSCFCYLNASLAFKSIYRRIIFCFYGTMSLGILISYLVRPIFQARYLFFIFPIYLCLTCFKLFTLIYNQNKLRNLFIIFVIPFLGLGIFRNSFEGICNIKRNYNVYSYTKAYKLQNKRSISLPFKHDDPCLTLQYSLYLPNNEITVKYKRGLLQTIQTGNTKNDKKIFNKLYPNIEFINNKKLR